MGLSRGWFHFGRSRPSPNPSPSAVAVIPDIPTPSPRAAHVLRIGIDDRPSSLALYGALEFLRGSETRVEFVTVPDASVRWQLLAAGRLDLACGSLDSFVSSLRLDPGVLIFKIGTSAGTDAIVGARGLDGLPALVGQDVAVTAGSPGRWLLAASLEKHGLSPSQVRVVEVDRPADAEHLLETGKVQAACLWGARAAAMVERGYPRLAATAPDARVIDDICVVNRRTLRDSRSDLRAFLQAWFTMASLLRKHSGLVYDPLARRLEMSVGAVAALLDGERFADLQENQRMDPDELVERMRNIQNIWLLVDASQPKVPIKAEALLEPGLLSTIEVTGPSTVFGNLPPLTPTPSARPATSPLPRPSPSATAEETPQASPSPVSEATPERSPEPSPTEDDGEPTP